MMERVFVARVIAMGLTAVASVLPAKARVSPEDAAHLGSVLTPMGAERAGNADHTIPEWTPGKQHGALKDTFLVNPEIDAEHPLFTISKANVEQYADKLDAGHIHLLSLYGTYKMNVYPSHRLVNYPDAIMKANIGNATTAELQGTDTLQNAKQGIPFPIPKTGAEAIWNQRLSYHADNARRFNNQMIVQPSGEYQLTKLVEDVRFLYSTLTNPVPASAGSMMLEYSATILAPPRMAGTLILAHEKNETRDAWLYSSGIGRVRRAPSVCCDNPFEGTDGMQFYDQVNMFNGTLERYNWKLQGKREMYVPYDSYRISGASLKFSDLARPHHLNQDLPHYELHRVWVVEATLRPGVQHVISRRVFYIDEDSWDIVGVEDYDARNQLWEYQEGHLLFVYNTLSAGNTPEVIYHFDSGRYFITGMFNEDQPPDTTISYPDDYFDPASIQKRATR